MESIDEMRSNKGMKELGRCTTIIKNLIFESGASAFAYKFRIVYDEPECSCRKLQYSEVKRKDGDTKLRHTADGSYILYMNRGELIFKFEANDIGNLEIIEDDTMIPSFVNKKDIIHTANQLEKRIEEGMRLMDIKSTGIPEYSWYGDKNTTVIRDHVKRRV